MTNDNIGGVFNKNKKKSTLTKPVKASKPTQKATATPKAKPIKVKPVKTPKVKALQVQQTQQPRQAPQYQNSDFKFMTSVEQAGITILTNFHGNLITNSCYRTRIMLSSLVFILRKSTITCKLEFVRARSGTMLTWFIKSSLLSLIS
jgi:hypothetical protein